MFHHRHDKDDGSHSPIASPPLKTVRLLHDEAELQEALERAKGYESRGFDEDSRGARTTCSPLNPLPRPPNPSRSVPVGGSRRPSRNLGTSRAEVREMARRG
jgi:hypothetical protein